jgi:enoyl-CoA hydratase/carnithine racemase
LPSDAVLCERQGPVAVLRLNRPDKHNAINRRLSSALVAHLDALAVDDGVRAVVITGAGEKAFCAGADMAEALRASRGEGRGDGTVDVIMRLVRFPKPVIAAVNGFAYGGGALLAIACDLRVAAHTARFRFPGAAYGLVIGGSQLPRIVGLSRAKDLIFTARVVDAAEALRIGLVDRLVAQPDLEEAALELAGQIAENSPEAVRASKEVIDAVLPLEPAARREMEANLTLGASEEHRRRFRDAAKRVAKGDPPDVGTEPPVGTEL